MKDRDAERREPCVSQVKLIGDVRKYKLTDELRQPRRAEIVAGYDEATGKIVFARKDDLPRNFSDDHLTEQDISDGYDFDSAEVDVDLKNIRKKPDGYTKAYWKVQRGDPDHKIEKPANSFMLGIRPSEAGAKNED